MEFTYAFVQKEKKIYSFLLRKNGTIDKMIFGDKDSLAIEDPGFWNEWIEEASFVEKQDTPDFLFLLPKDSPLKNKMIEGSEGSRWNDKTINMFVDSIIDKRNITGQFPSSFSIAGVPYCILIVRSSFLPAFN